MKFAHLADCHIGGWKEEKIKRLGIETFEQAINYCVKEHAAFILISA